MERPPTLAAEGGPGTLVQRHGSIELRLSQFSVSNFREIVYSSIRAFPNIGPNSPSPIVAAKRRGTSALRIRTNIEQGVETILVDGNSIPPDQGIHLIDDGEEHHVEAFIGPPNRAISNPAAKTTNLVNHHPKNGSSIMRETALE